ncbi:MAG: LacI family DNA-binding transcriptional regulator [Inquilinus sp.]|nr:LacI family DNA-binding transcriptional regulator [Inquilinus sp.]
MQRPTVNDIARAAGVSLATVDRVLNARPGVRDQTISRVHEAIEKIGYVRDVSAANLARQRHYRLAFVLPEGPGQFLSALRDAIAEAAQRSIADRTDITVVSVPAHDPHALARALNALDCDQIDGVAIMAPETPHVRDAVKRLKDGGVATVALVSDLPNSERDHFVGINNVAAGRTAAVLMGRFLGGRTCKVLVLVGSMQARDSIERRLGFDQVMAEQFPSVDVLPSIEGHDDAETIGRVVSTALDAHREIAGVYSLGSGNRALTDCLRGRGVANDLVVVAHELTPHTRDALNTNAIDAVITQDVGHVIRSALRVLRSKSDGLEIVRSQERIRIDIVMKENLP